MHHLRETGFISCGSPKVKGWISIQCTHEISAVQYKTKSKI